jgi:hypothetical protein
VATRSLPAPNTDGETDSGITWPPVEKLELVWFEKSPPPEGVAENFHLVPLNEIGARPGVVAEPPESVGPAKAPETEPLESWTPPTPVALAAAPVTAVERVPAIDQFRFVAPDPGIVRVNVAQWAYMVALAVCAVGLLLVIVVMWWRWPATPVQMTQAPAAAVADSQVPPPAPPAVVQPRGSKAATPAPAASSTVRGRHARPAVAAKPRPAPHARPPKAAVRAHATAVRRVVPVPAPKPPKAPPPRLVAPPPETALASVTPQPFTPQTPVGTAIAIEEQPSRPAPRSRSNAPANATAASTVVPPSDEQRIRAVLRSYQAAFEQFDPNAVQAVWPSVDTKALGRAFDGLSSQSIVFDRCDVSVAAATARAACHGGVQYVKRVGGGGTQSARRQWNFDLQKSSDGAWRIQSLNSR